MKKIDDHEKLAQAHAYWWSEPSGTSFSDDMMINNIFEVLTSALARIATLEAQVAALGTAMIEAAKCKAGRGVSIEFVTCPLCKARYLDYKTHRCRAEWLCWEPHMQEHYERHAVVRNGKLERARLPDIPASDTGTLGGNGAHLVSADSAKEAAEAFAERMDEDGCNDRECVFVRPYDDEEAEPVRFEVHAWISRNYDASAL